MPVEQARGEAVDERADVYALGAMLYHVLAGEPPFTGRSADAILAQVIADEVVPLDRRLTGAPPDLVTIVSKAMAKSAADRYPTAKQLAEDLKQFQTGQLVGSHRYSRRELLRRWVRRHRGAVTVGASLAVVLLVSSTLFVARIMSERDEANHQRTDAIAARDEAKARGEETQRRRVAAETLIDQLVFQLKEKLLAVGKLEVLTDLAQPISKYYDAVGEGEREPLALRRRAEAQDILGEIAVSQGKLDEAAARFDAAQHVLDQIDAPTPEVWNSRGKLLEKYGDLEQTRGSVAKAREYYDQALVADRKYLAARPTDPKAIRNVGAEISKLGELDTQTGHYDDALRHFRETRELLLPLARAMPDDTGRAQDLATVERKLAEVLGYQGKLEDAGASLMAAKELDERALAQHPGDAVLMRLLAIDQSLLAENLSGRGRAREVVAMSAGAVTQFERIVALDPSNVDRQRDLEVAYNNTGELMLTLGDRAAAMSVFRKGMAIAEQVYKKMPAHRVVIADLAFSLDKVGNMYRLARSYGEAADAYARAAKLNDQVLAASPKDHEAITNLAGCHVALGDISMARGDRAAAATAFRTALATRERLAADDANGAVDRAADHVRIGTALDPRDGPAARAEYEQGLELATTAAARWPAVTLASKIAATAHTALGTSSALAVPLRIQHLEAAVAGYEKLQKAEPLDELSRAHLAEAAQTLTRLRTR
jgi:tetratricopeptide (TPR) repeat protein